MGARYVVKEALRRLLGKPHTHSGITVSVATENLLRRDVWVWGLEKGPAVMDETGPRRKSFC